VFQIKNITDEQPVVLLLMAGHYYYSCIDAEKPFTVPLKIEPEFTWHIFDKDNKFGKMVNACLQQGAGKAKRLEKVITEEYEVVKKSFKFSTNYSNLIAQGFKNKLFAKAELRTKALPLCYYKMQEIDQRFHIYSKNVIVVAPGQCGSIKYHISKDRNIYSVGPLEVAKTDGFNICTEKFLNKQTLDEVVERVQCITSHWKSWTYENDAMVAYKGKPELSHGTLLRTSLDFIKRLNPPTVVQKVFYTDSDDNYNSLIFELCSLYSQVEISTPDDSSKGSTEAYLVLRVRRKVAVPFQIEKYVEEGLLNAYTELLNRKSEQTVKNLKKEQDTSKPKASKCRKTQKERIADVERYWSMEKQYLNSYAKQIWETIGIKTQSYNFSAAKGFLTSDNLCILKHDEKFMKGTYVAHVPHKMHDVFGTALGEYDVAFNGTTFVNLECIIEQREGHTEYRYKPEVCSGEEYLIVFDALRLFQAERKLSSVNFRNLIDNDAHITLMEGVPGSGKTYELIRSVGPKDIILTVAKRTKEETQERLHEIGNTETKIYTVDSFFINNQQHCEKVFIDEGLMLQPG
jgi:23S rRNA U2552 (ribose-2'-O)-methylase RlmE/FtsJ